MKKLIIFGTSNITECAYEYFTHDSDYSVVAFCVDDDFLDKVPSVLCSCPVVGFSQIEETYDPHTHSMFVAIGSQKLNRLRTQKVLEAEQKGYPLASYISSRAFVWSNVELGKHVFIQEDNTIQPYVKIGNNVTLWAGNHIGHSSTIEDNCFITSHVVISGHCHIGKNTFMGVNSATADTVVVGKDNFIGMGAIVTRSTADNVLLKAARSEIATLEATRFCKVTND